MCFTLEASKNSFLINLISCLILFFLFNEKNNENKIIAFMLFLVGLMQLYDWIFWSNQKKNNINFIFTKIAMLTNYLTPLLVALIIYYYKNKLNKYSIPLIIIYLIVFLIYLFTNFNNIDYTLVNQKSTPSLYWQWNHVNNHFFINLLYLITILGLVYLNLSFPINVIGCLFILLTLLFSYYYYKNTVLGRFWCYYASFIPIFIIIFYLIKNKIKSKI